MPRSGLAAKTQAGCLVNKCISQAPDARHGAPHLLIANSRKVILNITEVKPAIRCLFCGEEEVGRFSHCYFDSFLSLAGFNLFVYVVLLLLSWKRVNTGFGVDAQQILMRTVTAANRKSFGHFPCMNCNWERLQ